MKSLNLLLFILFIACKVLAQNELEFISISNDEMLVEKGNIYGHADTLFADINILDVTEIPDSFLSNVRHISGTLNIFWNDSLEDINGFNNLVSAGHLVIRANKNLKTISGLRSFECSYDEIRIMENDNLESINGLSKLRVFSGGIIKLKEGYRSDLIDSLKNEVAKLSIEELRLLRREGPYALEKFQLREQILNSPITAEDDLLTRAEKSLRFADKMPRFLRDSCENLQTKSARKDCSISAMLEYIYQTIEYPQKAKENGVEGIVVIQFVVTKTGDIDLVKAIKHLSEECDREAERVIKSMPKWIPAKKGEESLDCIYMMPIRYRT